MNGLATIEHLLDDPQQAEPVLSALRVQNWQRAHANFSKLAALGLPLDLLASLYVQLKDHLPSVSDPDMALNNLERFFVRSRSPLALGSLFERDPTAVPILLKIFSTSQYLTDLLVNDPESYDALRLTEGQPISRETLVDELTSELARTPVSDLSAAMTVIRRFKQRETLRIAFGDIIAQQQLQTVTDQISYLADAVCEGALAFCLRRQIDKFGQPVSSNGAAAEMVSIAMGKLGGSELNYSSDIDLIFIYDEEGHTNGAHATSNRNFFERVVRDFVKLLTENTALGVAYRVDLRLRPGGSKASLAISRQRALSYYDLQGRTWERQALVKARPVAGAMQLGHQVLNQLAPWIYHRSLSFTDIQGIKSLKRQIEHRAISAGDDELNIKTGRGGIRDIEFAIQFLQLLHGSDSKSLRTPNTLDAIAQLSAAGCISSQEHQLLEDGYRWLRKLEHRLQIMFDLQTHTLPADSHEQKKVAMRMDYASTPNQDTLTAFQTDLRQVTSNHRRILNHLLHHAFDDWEAGEGEEDRQEYSLVDLILERDPEESQVTQILGQFAFADPVQAYRQLVDLATEKNLFLSSRRCRHFFAAISPKLLSEISSTPNPDETLRTLSRVTESLGGKAVLWELFSSHVPSLHLFVRLCAACSYLCEILTSSPGMIDSVMDSLVMQELPSHEFLTRMLSDLLVGAEDIDPIIHSFKKAQHLRVGVRDILGNDAIRDTHRALADVAEVCVQEIACRELESLCQRFGSPEPHNGQEPTLIILAMGKLGGREPNYHSDIDLIFLYDGDGSRPTTGGRESTTTHDYFGRLAALITKRISTAGPYGRLYEIDNRLRPTGKSGTLAVSLNEFSRYFSCGDGQLWERLALCKARPIFCSNQANAESVYSVVRSLVANAITLDGWQPQYAHEIYDMRLRMEKGAKSSNIKRGSGGTVDVEFAVQMLQLKYAPQDRGVLVPGTLEAAEVLQQRGFLSTDDYEYLRKSYEMLRWVEARIRLTNSEARHDLPDSRETLAKLAFLLRYDHAQQMVDEIKYLQIENRRRLAKLIEIHAR